MSRRAELFRPAFSSRAVSEFRITSIVRCALILDQAKQMLSLFLNDDDDDEGQPTKPEARSQTVACTKLVYLVSHY